MAKISLVTTAALALALRELSFDDSNISIEISSPDPVPDFKELRADPIFRRERTHPKSFRKSK